MVYKGVFRRTGKQVALKILNTDCKERRVSNEVNQLVAAGCVVLGPCKPLAAVLWSAARACCSHACGAVLLAPRQWLEQRCAAAAFRAPRLVLRSRPPPGRPLGVQGTHANALLLVLLLGCD